MSPQWVATFETVFADRTVPLKQEPECCDLVYKKWPKVCYETATKSAFIKERFDLWAPKKKCWWYLEEQKKLGGGVIKSTDKSKPSPKSKKSPYQLSTVAPKK
jgi:hypothetical protein